MFIYRCQPQDKEIQTTSYTIGKRNITLNCDASLYLVMITILSIVHVYVRHAAHVPSGHMYMYVIVVMRHIHAPSGHISKEHGSYHVE